MVDLLNLLTIYVYFNSRIRSILGPPSLAHGALHLFQGPSLRLHFLCGVTRVVAMFDLMYPNNGVMFVMVAVY